MSSTASSQRVALVTGAADRIGSTMARRLAAAGYAVVVHHRGGADAAASLVTEIEATGGRAAAVRADLADRGQRAALIGSAANPFGPLTLLVNNASSFDADAAVDVNEALWDQHFAVHAEAPAFLSRDFANQLPEGAQGNIVNIVDERVLHLSPNYFSYTLSKSVLWTMTTTLAQSLAPRIRVNAIGPGPTLPHRGQSQQQFEQSALSNPLQINADPDAVADALMFILSARAMTGQMLAIDGGRHVDFPIRRGPTRRRP